jgi:hypothetical protein
VHLDKLTSSRTETTRPDSDLDTRVRRLAELIDSVSATRTPEPAPNVFENANAAAIRRLSVAATRLHQLTEEIDRRVRVGDWDAMDTLCARLLLDEIVVALRSCRIVATTCRERLEGVRDLVREGQRFIQRDQRESRATDMSSSP